MIRPFTYDQLPGRVVFGPGTLARLPEEVARLGAERAIVLSTPEQTAVAQDVARHLGARSAGVFAKAVMHVPIETAREARAEARRLNADCAVAVGGGSTTGLGKAIALDSGLPIIAVPTTYAGSEMTPIYGLTEGGLKKTGRDPRVLPRAVIYDPTLTLSLPAALSATSGMNAIAHCVEALYAVDANPIVSMWAAEGIRALAAALPIIVAKPDDLSARTDALYGAWLAGASLGAVSMALHHKLCHTLGGTFNLPHAETHTIVLPHATAYNSIAAPDAMASIARAIGAGDAARGLYDLAQRLGAPTSLRALGVQESDLDRAAEIASSAPYPNPRPIDRATIRQLLQNAWAGSPPSA
ncbi:MAG TPA: maleylacetate reductase [Vineibacter sp.]|nr:maleylacetate reductase [Vineibacter sp.]